MHNTICPLRTTIHSDIIKYVSFYYSSNNRLDSITRKCQMDALLHSHRAVCAKMFDDGGARGLRQNAQNLVLHAQTEN